MAAEALVSTVLEQLVAFVVQEAEQEVRQLVGVEEEVKKLKTTLEIIEAVLVDAEEREVKEVLVKVWLEKLKDLSYDMDDMLDEWRTSILKLQIEETENAAIPKKKVSSYIPYPCFCFDRIVLRHDIAVKIKEFRERLDAIDSEKDKHNFKSIFTNIEECSRQETTSFVDVLNIYGRDQDRDTIVSRLMCESSQEEIGIHTISIAGMGGIGKTTLAQLAYNDKIVNAHFEKRIWVCVSHPFDEIRIAKMIVEALENNAPNLFELENLLKRIETSIEGKKFLVVFDDVRDRDNKKLEPLIHSLKSGAQGSRILVTTRDTGVAKLMGTTYVYHLGKLSEEGSRALFSQIAFLGRGEKDRLILEDIGREIADKCKGLPLAAKALGSLMRIKETMQDWLNVRDSEIWELEVAEKDLFRPLLLSYYDLPSKLKRCFSYCAIFPKGYEIEVEKLIQLWMAQGYLGSRGSTEMETIGREYFQDLAMRSFFQDFEKDEEDGSIRSCKMHDIVHGFAQFLTKNECLMMEVANTKELGMDSSNRMGRHSTVILAAGAPFSVSIHTRKNLHTLFVVPKVTTGIGNVLVDLFYNLKCLRALDLSKNLINKLPKEVGKLMHLRYLNLSYNGLEKLPKEVCDLCNLQTLDLTFCWCLEELPKGMEKLINLRHLKISWTDKIGFLPKGIGRLSSLQTLREFFVKDGDDGEVFKLGDLKYLNNLKGRLRIRGLANMTEANEAKEAELKSKKHLTGLCLDFSPVGIQRKKDDVIEDLEPHSNLEFLEICHYRGTKIPKWLMSLTNLRKLILYFCRNCECLPSLGELPCLESLELKYMDGLKKLGVELLGFTIDGGTSSRDDGTDASAIIVFPMLKDLSFHTMNGWREWDAMITRKEDVKIMPRLRSLKIEDCPKLEALPHHLQTAPLEKLVIKLCPILQQRCQKETGEDWPKISHIPNINIQD